ncbi:hypothetical protein BV22DRAFT_1026171, partial [Leucogyrophana mollusca]
MDESQSLPCPNCGRIFPSRDDILDHLNDRRTTCWLDGQDNHIPIPHDLHYQRQARYHQPQDNPRLSTEPLPVPQGAQTGNPAHRFHPWSSYIYGVGQNVLQAMDSDPSAYRRAGVENVYYPFPNFATWELGTFLCECLTQTQMDRFLKLAWWTENERPAFKNKDTLLDWMDSLPSGPRWYSQEVTLEGYTTKKPIHLIWRDGLEVAKHLFANPIYAKHMAFDPVEIYNGVEREVGEYMSGDHAFATQVCIITNKLPEGATVVGIVAASDKTPVTRHTGDVEMHPTFLTLANIHSEVRMKATAHAWRCIAYVPVVEFEAHSDFQSILQGRLWHKCMDKVFVNLKIAAKIGHFMSDPYGALRYGFTPLRVDPWKLEEFQKEAKKVHLLGVHLPFWRNWAHSNPADFLVPEILHTCHKFFFDHVLVWCKEVVGHNELDARYQVQQKRVGTRHFGEGMSRVKQMTGREHRDIQRTIVAVIAGAAPHRFVKAVRAIVDFIYIAQNPVHTPSSIFNLLKALAEFHQEKGAILEAEARRGKRGTMENFWIPKLELLQSFARAIRNMGSIIQFTADVSERLLITHCKNPYQRTSRQRDFVEQCVRILNREERIRMFQLYAFLRSHGASLLNAIAEEDQQVSTETDPLCAWLSRILPDQKRYHGPRPVQNHFIKGILSDSADTAFHLTKAPDVPNLHVSNVAQTFGVADFYLVLADYAKRLPRSTQPWGSQLDYDLGFDFVRIWYKFRLQLHSSFKGNVVMPSQVVQALPPSQEMPFGKGDVVLLHDAELQEPNVAQVRVIFEPIARSGTNLPQHLSRPLIYVQNFCCVSSPTQLPHVDMYMVERIIRSGVTIDHAPVPMAGVYPMTSVTHSVELIPVFGEKMDRSLTQANVLELPRQFLLNTFSDKEVYHSLL